MKYLVFLLIPFLSVAKQYNFYLNVPYLTPAKSEFFLTGNKAINCEWEERCHQFKRIAPNTYKLSLEIKYPQFVEYKITRGTWDNQITGSVHEIYANQRLQIKTQNVYINAINYLDTPKHSAPQNNYKVFSLHSQFLNKSMTVRLYSPVQISSKENLKIIFAHDGQNLFDPNTSGFGNEWLIDEIAKDMYQKEMIPNFLVVGIDSDKDRTQMYSYQQMGKNYGKFITLELIPFLKNKYQLEIQRENSYLLGSSMGALISFTLLWNHGDYFSKAYGASLPAFAYDDQTFKFLDLYPTPKTREIEFMMDHGGIGQDSKYAPSAKRFVKRLSTEHFFEVSSYTVYPYANHTEVDWARRLNHILTKLLN